MGKPEGSQKCYDAASSYGSKEVMRYHLATLQKKEELS